MGIVTIRFRCNQCNKAFKVRDEDAGKKGKCLCGAILPIPLKKPILDKTVINIESQPNSISESVLAISIGSIALIWAFSFVGGLILTKPDKDLIAAQVEKIEQDISRAKNETEELKKQILSYRSNIPQVDTKQKRKVYGIDFSNFYRQSDGSLEQIRKIAAQLRSQMEADKSWTTNELLDQFSFESGFTRADLQKVTDKMIIDGKTHGENWDKYEALVLAGLFLENESHFAPKY